MGIDYSSLVYLQCQDMFGRPVSIGAASGRGIYHSEQINIMLEDSSIITDQNTYVDIRTREWGSIPQQGDLVNIPADGASEALGNFQVVNVWNNGGGEISLQLRRIV